MSSLFAPGGVAGLRAAASAGTDPATHPPAGMTGLRAAAHGASATGAPTAQKAKSGASKSEKLSKGTKKPCATCDTTPYSVQFRVKDSNGKLCAKMYYSAYSEDWGGVADTTDDEGLTKRYYGKESADKIYIYLGHRNNIAKDHPPSRNTEDNKYDEAPLIQDHFYDVAEKKIIDAKTSRQWSPWTFSDKGKQSIKDKEKFRKDIYNDAAPLGRAWDAPGGNPEETTNSKGFTFHGSSTIGWGHLLHKGPVDPDNPLDSPWIGRDMTPEEGDRQFDQDLTERAGTGDGKRSINKTVHVPLYDHEYDGVVNNTFNGISSSVKVNLNRGRYSAAGQSMLDYAHAEPGRKKEEFNIFKNGIYP